MVSKRDIHESYRVQRNVVAAVNEALEEMRAVVDSSDVIDVLAIDLAETVYGYSLEPDVILSYIKARWAVASDFDTIDIDVDWVAQPLIEGSYDGPVY